MLIEKFENKKVLITGHTGFKGAWLATWLKTLGAKVVGIAIEPPTEPSHFVAGNISAGMEDYRIDIRDRANLEEAVVSIQPDYVFHLAAQALVKRSYVDPVETWHTNVIGTMNLLEALRKIEKNCAAVLITSDKCYANAEWDWGYRETDALGGQDPYSASKGAAELVIRSYINSYFHKGANIVRVASARAGNVIGGGDWGLDRIIPDCVKAWSTDEAVSLRNPYSTRPWQHVLEPLSGYLTLALALYQQPEFHGEPFNFGPSPQQDRSVLQLVQETAHYWPQVTWQGYSDEQSGQYESNLLKLNCDKALRRLKWWAVLNFEETVQFTAEWYREYYSNPGKIGELTVSQIDKFTRLAHSRNLTWAK